MHIVDRIDAGVAHRHLDSLGCLVNLRVTADLLGQKVAAMGDANAQSLLAGVLAVVLDVRAPREHRDVRRQDAFRAAGHDERYAGFDLARRELETRSESVAQCGDGVFAGEVIDPAIPFGLAQHRENGRRLERAAVDKRHEAGHVSRPVGRNADHVERMHLHGPSASSANEAYQVPFHPASPDAPPPRLSRTNCCRARAFVQLAPIRIPAASTNAPPTITFAAADSGGTSM